MEHLRFRSLVNAPAGALFHWHDRPGAFERLNPPWQPVAMVERHGGIRDGDKAVLRMKMGPLAVTWVAEHHGYRQGEQFQDTQIKGPFASWTHTHRMKPAGEGHTQTQSILEDDISFRLPGGGLGRLLGGTMIRRQLSAVFAYRHHVTRHDVAAHQRAIEANVRPMRVAVSGASGLIGSGLCDLLSTGGHSVVRLTRRKDELQHPDAIFFDAISGQIEAEKLNGVDAVVHLAGANIAAGRWTASRKKVLRESRVVGTQVLAEAISRLRMPPKVFISASAIGIYGNRDEEPLTEASDTGETAAPGFLVELCRAWEQAGRSAQAAGIRVVRARFGVVLSPLGGALPKLLTPLKLGLGGIVGSGRQYWSWVSREDAVGALHHALVSDQIRGPMNVVSPTPLTNRELVKVLGGVMSRPTLLPAPAMGLRLALGQMADEVLLCSQRVEPAVLTGSGYLFRDPELPTALRLMLGRARFEDLATGLMRPGATTAGGQ